MRTNTSWLKESIKDLTNFARMNSLPEVGLALDRAVDVFEAEERAIQSRKEPRIEVLSQSGRST